jgi:hypothetical protein
MSLTNKLYDIGRKALVGGTAATFALMPSYSDARPRIRNHTPQTIERTVEQTPAQQMQQTQKITDYSYQEIKDVIGDYLIEKEETFKQNINASTPLDRNRIYQVFSKPKEVCEKLSPEEQKKYNEFNPNNLSDKKKKLYSENFPIRFDFKKQGTPYAGEKYNPIKLMLFLTEEHLNK